MAVGRLAEALGTADFTVRGETITALVPIGFIYCNVQDIYVSLSIQKQSHIGLCCCNAIFSAS